MLQSIHSQHTKMTYAPFSDFIFYKNERIIATEGYKFHASPSSFTDINININIDIII